MSALLFLLAMLVGSATCQDISVNYDLRSAQREEGAEGCPTTQQLRESIREDILKLINNSVLPALSLDGQQIRVCDCGGAGWRKVAYLNMSDANHNCPTEWSLFTSPKRLCGRPALNYSAYEPYYSAVFPTHNISYSHVCGRVIGYQYGGTKAFYTRAFLIENLNYTVRISGSYAYVDGVSLTYGEPKRHIWTFAAARDELENTDYGMHRRCPCTSPSSAATRTPSFVGNDYFCETGVPPGQWWDYKYYSDDPLWDGKGCGPTSTCCSFNNPPWFCKQLPQSTNADLEMRLCGAGYPEQENTLVELIEIYIKE